MNDDLKIFNNIYNKHYSKLICNEKWEKNEFGKKRIGLGRSRQKLTAHVLLLMQYISFVCLAQSDNSGLSQCKKPLSTMLPT